MSKSDKKNSNQSPKASGSKPRPKVDPTKTIGYRNDGINPNYRKQS